MEPLGFSIQDLFKTLLIVFRTGAFLMTVPVFGHGSIPRILRVWLILVLSFLIFPSVVVSEISPFSTTFQLAMVILTELAVGFSIGFTVIILFAAVQFAGHMIGLQMGLAVASVMDPMSAERISIIGEFYYIFSLLVFLLINGHHFIIEALVRSFELIPVGGGMFEGGLGEYIFSLSENIFVLAVKLAAPVIITLFIVNVVFGIVARTVPQMNVFIVGFPIALGIGLIMIRFSLPFFKTVLLDAFTVLELDISRIIIFLRG